MAFEVQKSLNSIVKSKGNIDNYVRNQLKYKSTKQLWNGLGAEQVDAVGLYLKQFENEQGIIIADQTGIGKGSAGCCGDTTRSYERLYSCLFH